MSTAIPPRPTPADWRTLYRSAILEPDRSIVRQRICEAEAAVLARGRELVYAGGTNDEKDAIEEALYLLRAYRNAWEHTDPEITAKAKSAA